LVNKGEGAQNQPWVLGPYEVVKSERGNTNKKHPIHLISASSLQHHHSGQQMNAAVSQEEVCSGTHSLILLHHVPSIPYENILFLKLHVLSILLLQIMFMSN
jgi:hypothetical protein